MHLGPDDVLLNLDIRFRRGLTLEEVESAVRRLEEKIRSLYPEIRRIFIEAGSLASVAKWEDGTPKDFDPSE